MQEINIFPVTTHKKQYLDLLLLADEQESMIDRYLERGDMFVLEDKGVKAICVVTDEGDGVCELKNIAVTPSSQRQGYGKKLINFLITHYSGKYSLMIVGTGDVPSAIGFYRSCGFEYSHRIENFFIDNYDHLMVEEGVVLKDMVYLKQKISEDIHSKHSSGRISTCGTLCNIRQLSNQEYSQAATLSLDVFIKCGKDDFDMEGLETFKKFIYSKELMNELTIFGAFDNNKLIGVIGTKHNGTHISLFFIDPAYHRQGIGRKLFDYAYANQRLEQITVSSSSYAVKFYESLGFSQTAKEQESHGLRSTPMVRHS